MSSPLYSPLCRNWHLLHGGCVLRREDCIFSSEDACSDEKIAFSRRRRRAPTRRLHFLVGGCVLRREDCVFSSEKACSDEKIAFSRRRRRAPTRRLRFLVGEGALRREDAFSRRRGRALRREECVFSSENALSDEKMACSRRRMRALTKRLHFLVDGCVLRRKDCIFSLVRWIRSKILESMIDRFVIPS